MDQRILFTIFRPDGLYLAESDELMGQMRASSQKLGDFLGNELILNTRQYELITIPLILNNHKPITEIKYRDLLRAVPDDIRDNFREIIISYKDVYNHIGRSSSRAILVLIFLQKDEIKNVTLKGRFFTDWLKTEYLHRLNYNRDSRAKMVVCKDDQIFAPKSDHIMGKIVDNRLDSDPNVSVLETTLTFVLLSDKFEPNESYILPQIQCRMSGIGPYYYFTKPVVENQEIVKIGPYYLGLTTVIGNDQPVPCVGF